MELGLDSDLRDLYSKLMNYDVGVANHQIPLHLKMMEDFLELDEKMRTFVVVVGGLFLTKLTWEPDSRETVEVVTECVENDLVLVVLVVLEFDFDRVQVGMAEELVEIVNDWILEDH